MAEEEGRTKYGSGSLKNVAEKRVVPSLRKGIFECKVNLKYTKNTYWLRVKYTMLLTGGAGMTLMKDSDWLTSQSVFPSTARLLNQSD